ncbi:TonB-linked outer membrane protein, SusC/RagA family [bacterium A37T11]|nr:TonB-linked outer membrane protein, SusC/RagA family [bacterium A37T11]
MYIKFTKGVLMRVNITSVIVLVAIMQVSAATLAQPYITIKKKSATLKDIFLAIKEQTDYSVFYSAKKLDDLRQVNANFVHAGLTEVLEKCVEGQPFTFTIEKQTILIKEKEKGMVDKVKDFFIVGGRATDEERGVPSQDGKTITGRVTDSIGTPLENATIRVKGTSRATFTNKNGEFILRGVEDNATLQISYLGFATREVPISDHLTTIILQRAEASLDEVDVVSNGYQVLSKERGTAAFDKVGQKLIERKISSDIISRIENLTPGVYFDIKNSSVENFTIRGISTLSSEIAKPLIILDNFPYDGDIENINPNDIQSITILKDGAPTSIWGARAGNGVIVITSKKGQYQEKSKISASSSVNLKEKPDLLAAKQMSTSDYIDVEEFLFKNGAFDGALSNTFNYPIVSPVALILQDERKKLITEADAESQINQLRNLDVRNDYLKYLYRTNVDQQYALNLSGGDKAVNYYVSAGYDKSLASLVGNQTQRFTFKNQTNYKTTDKLDISLALQYTNSKAQNNSLGGSLVQTRNYSRTDLYPYAQLKDADGNNSYIPQDYSKAFTDTAGAGRLLDWNYSPLNELANNDNKSKNNDWLANLAATYKITSFLNIEGRYQYESSISTGRENHNLDSYFTRNLINLFTAIGATSINYSVPMGGILDRSQGTINSHSGRVQLNYSQSFKQDKIAAIAGFELKQSQTNYQSDRLYGYDDNTLTFAKNVDFLNYYQTYDNLQYTDIIPNPVQLTQLLNRFVSMYANASYYFSDKYTVSGSVRRDQSNLFGVKTNQKGVPLWSMGGAWNLSNEKFYSSSFLPSLKLRYTYGRSGNVNNQLTALPTLIFRTVGSGRITNLPYATIGSYANPSLRWEQVAMHNIGLDFALKNQIISGYIEYYFKNSTDLISGVPADITATGSPTLTKNAASLRGRGLDVNLAASIINRAFNWLSSLNFSYDKTVVSRYYLKQSFPSAYVGGGSTSPIEGSNFYSIFAYKWAGLDPMNGDPQGYVDGKVSKDYSTIINQGQWQDIVNAGSSLPLYNGSWLNTFTYKSIELSVNIAYHFDYVLRKPSINYTALFNGAMEHSDYEKRWQAPGDEKHTNVPSMVFPADNYRDQFYAYSSTNIIKGDNIRIQDCNLSYHLKDRFAKSIYLSGLQIYSYINNIGIIWKANKEGIDPDTANGIRIPRSIGFGIRANL